MKHYEENLLVLERQVDLLLKIYEVKFNEIFEMGFDIDLIENLVTKSTPIDFFLLL